MIYIQRINGTQALALAIELLSGSVDTEHITIQEVPIFLGPVSYNVAYSADSPVLAEAISSGQVLIDTIRNQGETVNDGGPS